jgi:translation elongation factor EF-Tu-like GTPase
LALIVERAIFELMSTLLFTVVDTFQIEKRGLVVAADVKRDQTSLRAGDAIELRRPDGSSAITRVVGIERAIPYDPERTLAILLPGDITKEDVPIGTQVWSEPKGAA